MEKTGESNMDESQKSSDEGDVESAGETTAADAISEPTDESPVGAETMVKVAERKNGERSDKK